MRDNLGGYRAIHNAMTQHYPGQPAGTVVGLLTTLTLAECLWRTGRVAGETPGDASPVAPE